MRYYMIAGEASGDMHGASLIRALKSLRPQSTFRVWGGDRMEEAGGTLVRHYKDLAFMGFIEVARHLRTILRNIRECKEDIARFRPDALILIDYPGFNLRLAKWAHQENIPVLYYISPQVWAWHKSRVKTIRRYIDQMYVILPFERDFYHEHGMEVEYVGHPLIDEIDNYIRDTGPGKLQTSTVAILPGSRQQEIKHILPQVSRIFEHFPELDFHIAGTKHLDTAFYLKHIHSRAKNFTVSQGQTYAILHHAKAAITASGTATLETALFGVPQVVCYKGNALSFWIAKQLVKVPYISLVNLIAGRPLVTELIQHDLNPENVIRKLKEILEPDRSERIQEGYRNLRETLGHSGAAKRTAERITDFLLSNHQASQNQDFR